MKAEENKDRFLAEFAQFLINAAKFFPTAATGHFFDFVGRIAYFLLPGKRRIAYWNMRMALGKELTGKERRRQLRAQFRHLGRNLAEILTFEKLTRDEMLRTIQIEGWERIENAVASGRGAVLLTAHYGNWELMQIYSGLRGQPVHVLGREQKYPRLDELLMRQREVHGSVAVSRGMNVRFLLKALKEAKLVGVLGDQSAGRSGGILLPFFGKVTTVPTGAFDLAYRTRAVILPCFMIRVKDRQHQLYIEEALPETGTDDAEIVRSQAQAYFKRLEEYIRRSPRQWLWQNKRWKYSWTRKVVILSDQKPGHFKQSQAVASLFSQIKDYHGRPGLSFETKTIEIKYHSPGHAKVLFALGWLLLPLIRGRLDWLRFFISEKSLQDLSEVSADFIIAAGTSMAPIQHLFAAETGAKKIVLMKPSFPYHLFAYDLAIIPAHDEGWLPKHCFRTLISPSGYSDGNFDQETALLTAEISEGENPDVAVFIGGATREYDFTVADAEKIVSILERATAKTGGYMITTSRRTAVGVERFLKHNIGKISVCRKLVIASEDPRAFIAKGMLGLAHRVIVTEDSLAMISEAVASGKPVLVLRTHSTALPEKHRRFLEPLIRQGWVNTVSLAELSKALSEEIKADSAAAIKNEKNRLKDALEKLL